MKTMTLLLLTVPVLFACRHDAEETATPAELFFPRVKQIVQAQCTNSCHAPASGFPDGLPIVLETDDDLVDHAQSIKAAVADPITPFNHRMPPDDTLSTAQIDIIVQWAALGGLSTVAGTH